MGKGEGNWEGKQNYEKYEDSNTIGGEWDIFPYLREKVKDELVERG